MSGYAVRPPQVRREKPRVSAFTSADLPKILALDSDLVLTFSDLQAGIVADLVRAGVAVHAFNHRDVAGILAIPVEQWILLTVVVILLAISLVEEIRRRSAQAPARDGDRPRRG